MLFSVCKTSNAINILCPFPFYPLPQLMLILHQLLSFSPFYLSSLLHILYHPFCAEIAHVLFMLSKAWLSQALSLFIIMCFHPPVPLSYLLSLCSQVLLLVQIWKVSCVIHMVMVVENMSILQSANSVGDTLLLVP